MTGFKWFSRFKLLPDGGQWNECYTFSVSVVSVVMYKLDKTDAKSLCTLNVVLTMDHVPLSVGLDDIPNSLSVTDIHRPLMQTIWPDLPFSLT